MPDLSGTTIERYHLIEKLGEGGMATVYKAYDTRLEREVAVKIIRTDLFGSAVIERILKRFEREAKTMAKLSHANIVKVYDFGEYNDCPYLVMELLPGGTLKQLLGVPMPYYQAASLLLPIAQALEYAHEQKVIHRDVKPSNILLIHAGEPVLTDFGIAKLLELEQGQTLTGVGVGVGTPEYMSPEQGLGRDVDGRADIYAMGVVLYELIMGRKPYSADTPMAVLLKQVNDPLPRPSAIISNLPDAVEQVLFKALAKKPEDRYQSMAEFAAALKAILGSAATSAQEQTVPSPDLTLLQMRDPYATVEREMIDSLLHPGKNEDDLQQKLSSNSDDNLATVMQADPSGGPLGTADEETSNAEEKPVLPTQLTAMEFRTEPKTKVPVGWVVIGFVALAIGLIIGISSWTQAKNARELAYKIQSTATAQARNAKATATAHAIQAEATATAQARNAKATATAHAIQAEATATAQARENNIISLTNRSELVFGPMDGSLEHEEDENIEKVGSAVDLKDFIAEVTFFNPYSRYTADWDYGFLFRDMYRNDQYRLVIFSDETWILSNAIPDDEGDGWQSEYIADGEIPNLDTSANGRNEIRLICYGVKGFLYINQSFIAELDLSDRTNSGDVIVATGIYNGDEVDGQFTKFQDFTVWEIP